MYKIVVLFIILVGISSTLSACGRPDRSATPEAAPFLGDSDGLPLELSSEDYQRLNATAAERAYSPVNPGAITEAESQLQEILEVGKRNLDLLAHLDRKSGRGDGENPSYRERARRLGRGIPIAAPKEYGPALILARYQQWRRSMPQAWLALLDGQAEFPDLPPADAGALARLGKDLDLLYQDASRWLFMSKRLPALRHKRKLDVRGYYFLSLEKNVLARLETFAAQPASEREKLAEWLSGICGNALNTTFESCRTELLEAMQKKTLRAYYERYFPAARTVYERYFALEPAPSHWMDWVREPDEEALYVKFADPKATVWREFLAANIEAEWRAKGFQLKLDFIYPPGRHAWRWPQLRFEPGSVAYVSEGRVITLDTNISPDDPNNSWTIRHEFGHVLGFRDCYVEFYDEPRGVIMNYEIDTKNLMCSQGGTFLPIHYQRLKEAYGN